jgi:hypothetical protein
VLRNQEELAKRLKNADFGGGGPANGILHQSVAALSPSIAAAEAGAVGSGAGRRSRAETETPERASRSAQVRQRRSLRSSTIAATEESERRSSAQVK